MASELTYIFGSFVFRLNALPDYNQLQEKQYATIEIIGTLGHLVYLDTIERITTVDAFATK